MAGGFTKRGGRGGARGGGKFAKKRANDDDDTPRYSKRAKADEEEEEEVGDFVPELKKEGNGDHYISLKANDTRRVTISEFKGKLMVSIREYYEADGKKLPGKKGISLPLDQYNALLASAPLIESVLLKNKEHVVRPDYGTGAAAAATPADEETEEEVAEPVTKVEDEDEDESVHKVDDEDEE